MKGLIKLASLMAVMTVLSSCSCWNFWDNCNDPCSRTGQKCCSAPSIWEHNNCDQDNCY